MKKRLDKGEYMCNDDGLKLEKGMRMRPPVQSIYNRQVAKCLASISEVFELPDIVVDRIKKAIEYTCKDVDKINKRSPNGNQINGNY